jgi:hypothetical protein
MNFLLNFFIVIMVTIGLFGLLSTVHINIDKIFDVFSSF